jgi:hypothetical protein
MFVRGFLSKSLHKLTDLLYLHCFFPLTPKPSPDNWLSQECRALRMISIKFEMHGPGPSWHLTCPLGLLATSGATKKVLGFLLVATLRKSPSVRHSPQPLSRTLGFDWVHHFLQHPSSGIQSLQPTPGLLSTYTPNGDLRSWAISQTQRQQIYINGNCSSTFPQSTYPVMHRVGGKEKRACIAHFPAFGGYPRDFLSHLTGDTDAELAYLAFLGSTNKRQLVSFRGRGQYWGLN